MLATIFFLAAAAAPTGSSAPGAPIRIGLLGLDTSHATAFTAMLNDPTRADHIPGTRVVAAFKGGSWTMPRAVRYWLARDGTRITRVHELLLRAIFAWQRRLARERGIADGRRGQFTMAAVAGDRLVLRLDAQDGFPPLRTRDLALGDGPYALNGDREIALRVVRTQKLASILAAIPLEPDPSRGFVMVAIGRPAESAWPAPGRR